MVLLWCCRRVAAGYDGSGAAEMLERRVRGGPSVLPHCFVPHLVPYGVRGLWHIGSPFPELFPSSLRLPLSPFPFSAVTTFQPHL